MLNEIQIEFEKIVKRKKVEPIYSFLKKLTDKQKRELRPTIKKLSKHYSEFVQNGNNWRSRGTKEQTQIIDIASFVCFTGQEYGRLVFSWLEKETVLRIFEFYIPDWFNSYVNKPSRNEWYVPFRMDYNWMMALKNDGILDPNPELIVKLLPPFLYDSAKRKNSHHVDYTRNDAKLLHFPDTIESHIWLFFERESNIHWSDRYMNSNDSTENLLSWKQAFKVYSESGQIERSRLLKACLSTANMNFNKSSTGWFIDLFAYLDPTFEEMLNAQDSMLAVFNSPHSKPTNIVLKFFKKLCLEQGFLIDEFVASTAVLLSSETKITVTNTLMILDKLAKKYPKKVDGICIATSQAFVSTDSAIQTRAAKIISKYGNSDSKDLIDAIEMYKDLLLTDSFNLLSSFISEDNSIEEDFEEPEGQYPITDILAPENRVLSPENIDDLMFLASEVFDHNSELHFDVFPSTLVRLNDKITERNADRFEPALQRAYQLVLGDWRSNMGKLDHMLAVFFIDYTDSLIKRFPSNTSKLKKIRSVYREKEKTIRTINNQRYLYPFVNWFTNKDGRIYKPFYEKLLFALNQLKNNINLPVLSTPTHRPHWIDPNILVDRIKKWQDQNMHVGHADLQFAISRTYLVNVSKLESKLHGQLKGEPKRLLSFLFEKEALPIPPFETIAHWFSASITKNPVVEYSEFNKFTYSNEPRAIYTGDYSWNVGKTAFESTKWDYKKSKTVSFTDYRKMFKLNIRPKNTDSNPLKNIFNFKKSPKRGQDLMLYQEIFLKNEWYGTNDNDVKRFYAMLPNNPENLLAKICDKTLRYPEVSGETYKRMLINALESLLTREQTFHNMAQLIISCALISSDKTVRSLSAELWVHGENRSLIDSSKIGQYIGRHFFVEFAPLKRFTDLVIESMIRISGLHDKKLLLLLENIMLTMNVNVIRGQKKLLEIYMELLRRNDEQYIKALDSKFDAWSSSKSLLKPVKEIRNFNAG